MIQFNQLKERFDVFVFDSYKLEKEYLGAYRILYCILTLLIFGIPNFGWIGNSPDLIFSPPDISLASLFSGFPSAVFFTAADLVVVVLYVMLLFGWKTKYASLALFFTLLVCQSFSFAYGKIDHNIIWLIIPLIMAFSGWGNAYSLDAVIQKREEENSWAISLMALLLGFAMFTAGFAKIYSGWLSLDSQATLSHMVYNALYWERSPLLLPNILQIKSVFFWEALDYLAVIFELGFLFAIIWPQVFRFFILSAVLFHISVFLTFEIVFTINLLTYLLFINWAILNPVLSTRAFERGANKLLKPQYLILCMVLILSYFVFVITFQRDFVFPTLIELIIKGLDINIDIRLTKTIILFSISLLVAIASAGVFLYTKIYERRQMVTLKSKVLKREVV